VTVPAVVLIVLSGLLAACGGSSATPTAKVAPAQQQRVDVLHLAGTPNAWGYPTPFLFGDGVGNAFNSFVYDTLAWKDKNGKFIPLLATSWKTVENGAAWDIQLRKGVKFSDGVPFTANDVAFTFWYMTQGAGKNTGDAFGHAVTSEKVVSPTEVIVGTGQPFGGMDEMILGLVHILPQHIWQNVSDPFSFNTPQAYIGTGPYDLVSADPTTGSYLFTARDGYFMGPPLVKRVEFAPAPTDPLSALKTGTLDMASIPQGAAPASYAGFQTGDFTVVKGHGVGVASIYFNWSRGFPYTDLNFRKAIAYGVNSNEIIQRALFGNAELASYGGLPPSDVWTAKNLPTYSYDLNKAKSLLDQAGLKLVNGVRTLPNGQPFAPTIVLSSTFNTSVAAMVKEYLLALGINATFQSLDNASAGKAQAQGRYDMALVSTGPGVDPIDLSRVYMEKTNAVPGSWTVHGYDNPQYAQLWEQQKSTADPTKRMQIVTQMEQITARDVVKVDMYSTYNMAAYRNSAGVQWYFVPAGTLDGYGGIINKYILAVGK
jgi:peptide/nickel transport system substrate-binding protein